MPPRQRECIEQLRACLGDRPQQQRRGRYIFPYDPKSVSVAFTDACRMLGIEDLTVHGLRHEATSRLFELGYEIHEVAQFTFHRSWEELKRYTNLRPENLREIITLESGDRIVQPALVNIKTLPCFARMRIDVRGRVQLSIPINCGPP